MYKHTIQLAPGETLQLDWGRNFSNFLVYLNGQLIGSVPDKSTLKLGRRIDLPGNRYLMIILADHGLEVWYEGTDLLTGMKSGTSDHFSNAANFLIGFGTVQLVIGTIIVLTMVAGTMNIASAALVFAAGAILIGLGIWAKKTGLNTPLKIAIGFLLINAFLNMMAFRLLGLIVTGILIYYTYKGIEAGAIHQIPPERQQREDAPLDAGV